MKLEDKKKDLMDRMSQWSKDNDKLFSRLVYWFFTIMIALVLLYICFLNN